MGNHGSTRELTAAHLDIHLDTIEPAVSQLIQRLIENDARFEPAMDEDEIILDIEVEGVRYLAIRCGLRSAPAPKPTTEPDNAGPDPSPALSPREVEIARMVAKGYANKSIASVLDISSWTVSSHLRRIYTKLGVTSRAAMVARLLLDGRGDESRQLSRPSGQRA
jgi:DNA-binding CsgD family transcriptional regulator